MDRVEFDSWLGQLKASGAILQAQQARIDALQVQRKELMEKPDRETARASLIKLNAQLDHELGELHRLEKEHYARTLSNISQS